MSNTGPRWGPGRQTCLLYASPMWHMGPGPIMYIGPGPIPSIGPGPIPSIGPDLFST